MQSVSYRDRSFIERLSLNVSVEKKLTWIWKTPMEWVNGISDYPPDLLNFRGDTTGSRSFSDCICLWCHWTQGGCIELYRQGSVCPEITPSRIFTLEHPLDSCSWVLEPSLEDFIGQPTRTPKYSCRDCWTGVNPMKNDQQNSNDNILFGLQKRTPSNKPKEKRILETVNRVITRIQNDERNYLWPNILTRPV